MHRFERVRASFGVGEWYAGTGRMETNKYFRFGSVRFGVSCRVRYAAGEMDDGCARRGRRHDDGWIGKL